MQGVTEKPPIWKRVPIVSERVTIVPPADWVSVADAQRALGLGTFWVTTMVNVGELERAATHPRPWTKDEIGVTATSLAPQVATWTSGTTAERRRRKRRLFLKNILNSI